MEGKRYLSKEKEEAKKINDINGIKKKKIKIKRKK